MQRGGELQGLLGNGTTRLQLKIINTHINKVQGLIMLGVSRSGKGPLKLLKTSK